MKRKRQRLGIRDCRVCGQSLADVCQGCVGVDLAVYAAKCTAKQLTTFQRWLGREKRRYMSIFSATPPSDTAARLRAQTEVETIERVQVYLSRRHALPKRSADK